MKRWKKTHRERRGHLGPYQQNRLTPEDRQRRARKRLLRAEEGPKGRRERRTKERAQEVLALRMARAERNSTRLAKRKARAAR